MKPTPGKWVVHPRFPYYVVPESHKDKKIGHHVDPEADKEMFATVIFDCSRHSPRRMSEEEMASNALLAADAGATYHATGLTPSELAAQRDELLETLKYVLSEIEASDYWWMDCPNKGGFDADKIRSAITNATKGEK